MKLSKATARSWFERAWEQNTVISGFLALAIWSVICYLSVIGTEPPAVLVGAGGMIIGYFFSKKSQQDGRDLSDKK